jgi:hypothetical protein
VPARAVHPEAFDFDAMYTRSLTEALAGIKALDPTDYSCIVIDSMTHMWEAAKQAYSGRQTKIGTIPFQAWAQIKKPYKEMISYLLSSPMHVLICGRQGVEYETDEDTEELKAVGLKMKAEGETPYEPHILIRMESVRPKKTNEVATIYAYVEKDRTGVLNGRTYANPTFDSLCLPILGLLGDHQAEMWSDDQTAAYDAERLSDQENARQEQSAAHLREFKARIVLCKTPDEIKAIGKLITKELKAAMTTADVADLREAYQEREQSLGNVRVAPANGDTKPAAEGAHTVGPGDDLEMSGKVPASPALLTELSKTCIAHKANETKLAHELFGKDVVNLTTAEARALIVRVEKGE